MTATPDTAPVQRWTVPFHRLYRAELRWIFRRPRTLIVLGLLALIPVIIGIGLTLAGDSGPSPDDPGGRESLLPVAAGNALVLPLAVLGFTLNLLLPLIAASSAGDALAGEAATGTLRGLMLAPVSRGRLLLVKASGVATFTLAATLLMSLVAMATGLVLNGADSLFTLSGNTLTLVDAIGRVALAVVWVTLQLWAVAAVALAVSACTEHPMLVVVAMLAGVIVSSVLLLLSAVDWLHPVLLPRSWMAITDILRDPVPADQLGEGAIRAVCYIVIGLSLAYARLSTKDG